MTNSSGLIVNPSFSNRVWKRPLLLVIALCMIIFSLRAVADVNVLIVGTTADTGAYSPSTYGLSKAFDIAKVRDELQSILAGAGLGTVKVGLHDLKANMYSARGNQLISEFYSQNTARPPVSFDFWKNLRGESGTNWNYVILMDDPNTIEYFPGLYTLGVSEVGKEVAKGGGETVLLMLWPGSGSESSVNHYKEVVYRTGRSLGYKVVPAGLAWQDRGSVYGTTHPTAEGAYMTAAAIYSRIWGVEGGQDKSASTSTYHPNDTLADAVHQVVKDNKGKVQYTGAFMQPSNLFNPIGDHRREWLTGIGLNSSSENGLQAKMVTVGRNSGMDITDNGTAPNGIFITRDSSQYNNSYSLNSHFWLTPYADIYGDNDGNNEAFEFINLVDYDHSSFIRTSRGLLGACPTYRHLPHPVLFAQVLKEIPDHPLVESQHGGRGYGYSAASYWLFMNSGRCGMIPKPSTNTVEYESFKVGYETAWRMSTLQGRAPGFQVRPSDWKRHEVDPAAPETMTVRFMFAPKENVTVTISNDVAWATVTPQTLTFTPENYATQQTVTVSLSAEAASLRGSLFNVIYHTSSTDEVYDNLSDSWEYGVNTLPIANSQSVAMQANQSKVIALTSVDPDVISRIVYAKGSEIPKQVISYSVAEAPQNGTVVINGTTANYTPADDFAGPDSFTFRAFDGLDYGVVTGTVAITVMAKGQYQMNLIVNPGAEFGLTGWTGQWISLFNQPGNIAVGSAHSGAYSFKADTVSPTVELYQDVDISDYAAGINAGIQSFQFSGWGNDKDRDDARLALEFRDASGQVLGTPYESTRVGADAWTYVETTLLVPRNAVVARVILRGTKLVDSKNLAHFDDLSLKAIRPVNSAPVAVDPPQASIAMNVPTVIPLAASDVDRFPSNTLTYEVLTGPQHGSITGWSGNMPIYTPTNNYLGTDSFTFRVSDGHVYSANTGTASILVRTNQAPAIVVNRPTRDSIYMAATAGMIFETSVTDDGGPVVPGHVTIQWEQTSGPEGITAVFGSPNAETTTCNWGDMNDGTYEFRMTASDGELQTVKNFVVTVLNGGYDSVDNIAPQTDVGGPYGTATVGIPLTLQGGDLSDDWKPLDPGVTTTEWLQISGPGTATFSEPSRYDSDVIFDLAGTYVLRLTGDDGQVKSYEDLTITVVGTLPTVAWSVAGQASAGETNTMTVTAQLSAVSSNAVTVPFTLSGTAKLNTDYSISGGSISIPAGSTTGSVTIDILSDTLDEDDETVILTMGAPVNAIKGSPSVHTATITDDDATPSVQFSTASQTSAGEAGTMAVMAQLTTAAGRNVTVPFTITGTATLDTDYAITASPIVIPAGATTASATITIIPDTTVEPNETVILTMGTPTNATLNTRKVHTATIKEGGAVAWSVASQASAGESGTMVVTAQLSGALTNDVTVPFTFTGTATLDKDYTITSSPIVIPAGSTTGSVTITIIPDDFDEGNETVMVTMGTVTGALKATPSVHTALITNDDVNAAPVVNAGPPQTILFGQIPWTPREIVVTAWFDGNNQSSMTQSNGAVTRWSDLSGNNNNLIQNTTNAQPTTGTVTINGLNAVDFDGSNDKMAMAGNPFGSTINDALVMVVHKVKSTTANGTLFSLSGSTTATNFWQANVPASNGSLNFDTGGNSSPKRVSKAAAFTVNEVSMSGFYGSTSDTVQQVYKNGTLLIGDATGHAVATAGNPAIGGLSSYQNTSIGEVVILNGVVSTADRQKLEGYLAHKWGLAANLPTNHPYKATAPMVQGNIVNLDGTVTDGNNDPLRTSWTLVSGPAAYTIADPSAVDTTVTFKAPGTYTFRLTVDDGFGTVTDEVVIRVNDVSAVTANHAVPHAWLSACNAGWSANYEAAVTNDVDGDGFATWQEYWSGTDPQDSNSCLKIDSIEMSGGNLIVKWRHAAVDAAIPPIVIQSRSNLTSGSWITVGTHAPANGQNTWSAASSVQGFYRLAVTNAP
jgi:Bacterial Ig domain/Calx-beta domain